MVDPKRSFAELLKACREEKEKVIIDDLALEGALAFKLIGEEAIKEFLANEVQIEDVAHQNTEELRSWKGPPPIPTVEAFCFQARSKYAYFAYYFIQKAGRWTVKSFKENESAGMVTQVVMKDFQKIPKDLKQSPFAALGKKNVLKVSKENGNEDK